MGQYKFFAFISYNSKDTKWGKRLQQKLEGYRMPTTLCSQHGWKRKPINPVFFAPTDIQPGGLTQELQERLKASRNLIVICSPNSAKSEWVGKEIEFFHSLGRTKNIHFFIVDGVPHSDNPDTECFNPVIDRLGLPEILGANIHERIYRLPWLNRERAYVQLITKLLGVEFDGIWQRHKRLLIQKVAAWAVGILFVLALLMGVWVNSQPVDVSVQLNEQSCHNDNLPPLEKAVITLVLDRENKHDTISGIDEQGAFLHVPHHFLNEKVNVRVRYLNEDSLRWLPVDTAVVLTRNVAIGISRNTNYYGRVHFGLFNSNGGQWMSGIKVSVEGIYAVSDSDGMVDLFVPLEKQRTAYKVTTELTLETDSITMPNGEVDALKIK